MNTTESVLALLSAPLLPLVALQAKPNIIVVLSDDVGLSRIGCYGGAPFKTPHPDNLAATGLRFERHAERHSIGVDAGVGVTGYNIYDGAREVRQPVRQILCRRSLKTSHLSRR